MQLPFFPQDSTFSYEIAPLCFLAIAFRESPWCGYITDCRRAASEKHGARGASTVSVWTKTFLSKRKRHFFILGKKTHILLVVSFFFSVLFPCSCIVNSRKKKKDLCDSRLVQPLLMGWTGLTGLEPRTTVQRHTYWLLHKVFTHTKVPNLNLHVLLKGSITGPTTLLLYHALCTIRKNTRASGVPEVSCGQSHGMTARPLSETITVFHEDSSRPRAFYKTAAHSDIYPLQGFC